MKYPEGNRVFIVCEGGYLYAYLINEKRIAHNFGNFLDDDISCLATTFDNKYLFVCAGMVVLESLILEHISKSKTLE